MVFPIVSTHIRKNDKLTKSACLISTALFALSCLSACSTQDDGSAQLNSASAHESAENNKNVKVQNVSVNAGREIFERSNCAMCHPGGNNTMDPGHPIKGPDFAHKYADDALLEATIRKGFPDVGMPTFSKKQIDEQEMKNLIAYVRGLTAPSKVTPQTTKSPAGKSTK
jgi:mono/diheme cytochrome c family protein